jgi:hypothetical protein
MSPVPKGPLPGTTVRRLQVAPPSVEIKKGALGPPIGAGRNAVATMWLGFAGLTAMFGSLFWLESPLSDRGTMLTMWSIGLAPYLRSTSNCCVGW